MFTSREKRMLAPPVDDEHDAGNRGEPACARCREEDPSTQFPGEFDPDPIDQVRWLPRLLALLAIACVLLAAWVWVQILQL